MRARSAGRSKSMRTCSANTAGWWARGGRPVSVWGAGSPPAPPPPATTGRAAEGGVGGRGWGCVLSDGVRRGQRPVQSGETVRGRRDKGPGRHAGAIGGALQEHANLLGEHGGLVGRGEQAVDVWGDELAHRPTADGDDG